MPAAEAPILDEPAARRLTLNIRLRLDAIASGIEEILPLIEQARDGGAHLALGFKSWTAYVEHEFGGQITRLGRADRRPLVELLAGTGMPTRAIAAVVGASQTTVVRDLEPQPGEPKGSPEPTDADAEQIAAKADGDLSPENVSRRLTLISGGQPKARRTVTGRDGKTYTAPRPRPPRPPKYGPRRKHLQVLEAMTTALAGMTMAADEITELDSSVTREEATRLVRDLSQQVRSLDRIRTLVKERTR